MMDPPYPARASDGRSPPSQWHSFKLAGKHTVRLDQIPLTRKLYALLDEGRTLNELVEAFGMGAMVPYPTNVTQDTISKIAKASRLAAIPELREALPALYVRAMDVYTRFRAQPMTAPQVRLEFLPSDLVEDGLSVSRPTLMQLLEDVTPTTVVLKIVSPRAQRVAHHAIDWSAAAGEAHLRKRKRGEPDDGRRLSTLDPRDPVAYWLHAQTKHSTTSNPGRAVRDVRAPIARVDQSALVTGPGRRSPTSSAPPGFAPPTSGSDLIRATSAPPEYADPTLGKTSSPNRKPHPNPSGPPAEFRDGEPLLATDCTLFASEIAPTVEAQCGAVDVGYWHAGVHGAVTLRRGEEFVILDSMAHKAFGLRDGGEHACQEGSASEKRWSRMVGREWGLFNHLSNALRLIEPGTYARSAGGRETLRHQLRLEPFCTETGA
ncbi:MAG: hypothetical protein M1826_001889 [Phylliscum demangeonii]|nr:MAG: hypothetical protein M1826_001889 [Phylliscum demangeonii]